MIACGLFGRRVVVTVEIRSLGVRLPVTAALTKGIGYPAACDALIRTTAITGLDVSYQACIVPEFADAVGQQVLQFVSFRNGCIWMYDQVQFDETFRAALAGPDAMHAKHFSMAS